jgi:Mat/Ecp fimbriae outer membrane usher protein
MRLQNNNKMRLPYATGFICVLACVSCFAGPNPKEKSKTKPKPPPKIFTVSNLPPPGFEIISKPQRILVDVNFAAQFVGVFKAEVSPKYIRFKLPGFLVSKIPSVKNKEAVTKALSGKLEPNSQLVCNKFNAQDCNQLKPKVAGVIYNPRTFQLQVFIAPQYLRKTMAHQRYLPISTAGPSYVNHLSFVTSDVTGKPVKHTFNFTTDNTFAYYNTHFNVSASYANDLADNNGLSLNHANISWVRKRWLVDAGMAETLGNTFFANQTILGAQLRTTLDTMPEADDGLGLPLVVFLNFPAQIAIYKDGKLISTGHYAPGNNDIDTANFPEGAYPISIKVTDAQGQTTTEQRYYVKTNELAPHGLPQFYLSAGYLIGNNGFNGSARRKLLNKPVYQAGTDIRLADAWGLDLSMLGNDKAAYGNLGLAYINRYFEVIPMGLIGTDKSLGFSGVLKFHFKRFDMTNNVTRIWHGNQHVNPSELNLHDEPLDEETNKQVLVYDPDFRFLSLNTWLVGSYMNLHIGERSNLSFNATLSDTKFSPLTYAYGPAFTTELFHYFHSNINFSLSGNKTQAGYNVLAAMSIAFAKDNWDGGGTGGYNYDKTRDNTNQVHNSGFTGNASLAYNRIDSTQNGYSIGVNANTTPASSGGGGNVTYENNRIQMHAYGNYNKPWNLGGFTQYGGDAQTRIVWTPHAWTIGAGDNSSDTGVVVIVDAPPSKNPQFDVYANNNLVKHVMANQNTFIKLPPYQDYQVSVVNTSKHLYSIKDVIQKITLYPGNIQPIHWEALQKHVIAGQIVGPLGMPLGDATLQTSLGYNVTDQNGYFQTDVSSKDKKLMVVRDNKNCEVNLPPFALNKEFKYVDKLYCLPILKKGKS